MKPISLMNDDAAAGVRWVLTDVDDTMTRDGVLVPAAYAALCALKASGLRVIAVTGRSAGWGQVHLFEWPLDAVIAENGAVTYFRDGRGQGELAFPSAARNTDPDLVDAARRALAEVKRARPASDNNLRLYDLAIDHAERVSPPLSAGEVARIVGIFAEAGCEARPSSIHVNCWKGAFDKRSAAVAYLSAREGYDDGRDRDAVLYVGDALNDEVMFAHFPNACAVANIAAWLDSLEHLPAWVSRASYGEGFAEIAERILSARGM